MSICRGPNASNPARGRTLPGQERPSNGRPDASQRRPGSMLCPVGLPGALSVDILALLLYWPTYAPITVRLTSDTDVAYWQWRSELPLNLQKLVYYSRKCQQTYQGSHVAKGYFRYINFRFRFSQSQRGRIMDRKLGCPRGVHPAAVQPITTRPHIRDRKTGAPWATQLPVHNAFALWLAEPGHPRDSFNSDAHMQQWTSSSLGLDNGISPDRRQAII